MNATVAIDPNTLFFASGVCAVALGLTIWSIWLQQRKDKFLLGWTLAMIFLGSGALIYYASSLPFRIASIIAFSLEIVGVAAIYVSARDFAGRKTRARFVVGICLVLLALIDIPSFLGATGVGVIVFNGAAATSLALSGALYWERRPEAPASIVAVSALYMLAALSFALCSAVLLHRQTWVLTEAPRNWAESLNAVMTMVGTTGIGALSLSLNQSRIAQRYQTASRTDWLTGLFNRRALFEALAIAPIQPGDVVAVFDLDRFKSINDRFGHDIGDEVLRRFAETLEENLAEGALAARMGGEEFVVVMRQCAGPEAMTAIERIRMAFSRKAAPVVRLGMPITTSAGLAFVREEDVGRETVFRRADEALYRAKNQGRNRSCTESFVPDRLASGQ